MIHARVALDDIPGRPGKAMCACGMTSYKAYRTEKAKRAWFLRHLDVQRSSEPPARTDRFNDPVRGVRSVIDVHLPP